MTVDAEKNFYFIFVPEQRYYSQERRNYFFEFTGINIAFCN
jgi:hypothetical protein